MVIDNFNALYSFNNNYTMLDFVTQKKILEPLLKDPRNHLCADCDAVSPTCTFKLNQGFRLILEFSYVPTAQEHIEL